MTNKAQLITSRLCLIYQGHVKHSSLMTSQNKSAQSNLERGPRRSAVGHGAGCGQNV